MSKMMLVSLAVCFFVGAHGISETQVKKLNGLADKDLKDHFNKIDPNKDAGEQYAAALWSAISNGAADFKILRTNADLASDALFKHMDKNNDKEIDRSEFMTAIKAAMIDDTGIAFAELIALADNDNGGDLDTEEVKTMGLQNCPAGPNHKLDYAEAVKCLDDGDKGKLDDGVITAAELVKHVPTAGTSETAELFARWNEFVTGVETYVTKNKV